MSKPPDQVASPASIAPASNSTALVDAANVRRARPVARAAAHRSQQGGWAREAAPIGEQRLIDNAGAIPDPASDWTRCGAASVDWRARLAAPSMGRAGLPPRVPLCNSGPGASPDRAIACCQACSPPASPARSLQPSSQQPDQQQQRQPRPTMLRATARMWAQMPRAWGPAAAAATPPLRRPLHSAVVCCQPPAAPAQPAAKAPAIPPVKRITRGVYDRCCHGWRCGVNMPSAACCLLPAGTLPLPRRSRHHAPTRPPPLPAQTTWRSRLRAAAARAGRTSTR